MTDEPAVVQDSSVACQAFISYASADSSVANAVCSALERAGVKCWIAPRDVAPGEVYASNIVHAIDTTRVIVLVLSEHAADSAHVLREVERACSKRHPILSFRIDQAPLPESLEYFLNTQQWLDASTTGVNRALPRLVDAVKGVLGKLTPAAGVGQVRKVTAIARWRPRYMLLALAVIVAAALSYFVADRFWLSKRIEPQAASVDAAAPASAASPDALATPQKSIAVLPFADMSPAKDQEYLADGIAEELLNRLAKAPDLKVIARTSSFAFKGRDIDIADIAKRLNVAHVLEGSVRKSGDRVRITAQLIRASDSSHLWSDTYDRKLDDIFALQDELAAAIMHALSVRIAGGTIGRKEGGTPSREAYELYLRAWYGEDWDSRDSLDAVEKYLKQAIAIDPEYGLAWSGLASVTTMRAELGYLSAKEAFGSARQFVERALQLAPESADAHAVLQNILFVYDWNLPAAEGSARRALALGPTNPDVLNTCSRLAIALGRLDDARRQLLIAVARDPLNDYVIYNLALTYYLAGQLAEAEKTTRRLFDVSPNFPWTRVLLGQTLLLEGRIDEAVSVLQEEPNRGSRLASLPLILRAAGRQEEAERALRDQIEYWKDKSASFIALSYADRGNYDLALQWLERAYEQRDPSLFEVIADPLFGDMRQDPGFKAFRRRLSLPELAEGA